MAAATDRFVAWCKQEQASIEQELELLASGKVRIGEDIGSGWIDKTDEAIERARRRLSQLKELLTEGKTTSLSRMPHSLIACRRLPAPARPRVRFAGLCSLRVALTQNWHAPLRRADLSCFGPIMTVTWVTDGRT